MVERMSFGAQLSRFHSWICHFAGFGKLFCLFVPQFPYLENG